MQPASPSPPPSEQLCGHGGLDERETARTGLLLRITALPRFVASAEASSSVSVNTTTAATTARWLRTAEHDLRHALHVASLGGFKARNTKPTTFWGEAGIGFGDLFGAGLPGRLGSCVAIQQLVGTLTPSAEGVVQQIRQPQGTRLRYAGPAQPPRSHPEMTSRYSPSYDAGISTPRLRQR